MSNLVDDAQGAGSGAQPEFDPFAGPLLLATVPSTEPQREIWAAMQVVDDASLAYNESITLWMKGALDVETLRQALADLVARHEALRATFSGDGLTLMVNESMVVPFEVLDWSCEPAEAQLDAWDALLAREVTLPFDLQHGPLARAVVVKVGAGDHRFVFTAHHIVCDGWSTAVLVRDLAALYSSRRGSTAAPLAPADGFSGYALALARSHGDAQSSADEAYWLQRFSGEIPILDLPVDRARPPLKSYGAAREDVTLGADLVRDLKRVGSKERASLFATLLAGFATLLSRLSNQDDLVVGIPAAGQAAGDHENLVGHCVNMLPLRLRVDLEQPFTALLGQARTTVLDAFEHQNHTFGALLRKLPIPRDPSRSPLVSVIFNVDRGMASDAMRFEGLETRLTTNPRHFENFELFLNAVELDGEVQLECQYNTDLFDRETVRRWLATYEQILRGVVADPVCAVGGIPILTDAERAQLRAWNAATLLETPHGTCVHQLIEAQAARAPSAIAVVYEGTKISYADLDARANAVAQRLRALGVRRGALVGLCVERSIDMVVGLLGILKAGGAYVPLDPGYPIDRLAFMAQDSQMRVLVTQEALRAELPVAVEHVVTLEAVERAGAPLADGEDAARAEDVAYVIYTSGSTGKPKGVLVPHRAVVNLLASVRRTPGMSERDVVLAVTTLSFDIAVSEVILPLTVGASIVLASREVAADGVRLLALLDESKATFLDATPATWRLMLAAGWRGGEGLKAICTGEAMPRDLAVTLVARCGSVWNGYGPTETTVWSTFYEVKAPVGRVLIGRPVANTQVYVVDARMNEVPIGVVGELFIGGAGVTHGYWNRPELTRERFVMHPALGGDRTLYRTGDLVRVLPDGNLECLGRNDSQVKVRGFRIELGEIENALGQHPAVAQVAVIVREDRPGDVRLVGYVALAAGANPTDAELRAHLKSSLPDYMVPQAIVRLPTMPLTPSGKIDRKKLPAPQAGSAVAASDFVAPRTDAERKLAVIWQEVLGVGRVSAHDDFFALGGHSLLASQVLARLRRDHGVNLTFRKMFEAPTLAKLAALMEGAPSASAAAAETAIPRRVTAEPAPLSVAQRRLWLLEEMDPQQRLVHNLPAAWRLDGTLDMAALQASVDELVRRHDTLRTNLRKQGGEPVQVIADDRRIVIDQVDMREVPEAQRERAIEARADELTTVPFDLERDALLRITLFRTGESSYVLYTLRHNIIWDGWSFDIFLRDLSALYGAISRGAANPLAPLPIAYADYCEWQRTWLPGEGSGQQAEFWRTQFIDEPAPLELPTDRPRKGSRSHAGSNVGIHIPRATGEALTAFARERGATLYMTLFAAFNLLLHRHSGQTDVLVGTPVRARTRPELEDIIGPFVNTVVLRTKMAPSMTFADLLDRVRDATLDAFSHQDFPLESLGGRPPMVRAFFSLQDARSRPPSFGDVQVSQWHVQPPAAASEMMLWTMETRGDLFAMLNYSTDLFDAATAERFLAEFANVLDEVLRDPQQTIGSLPIPPVAERERIAALAAPANARDASDVTEIVRAHARETPDAVAVTHDGQATTYRELVRRTNRLARELQARGAGPGKRVAVRLRGSDVVAGALAVLTSGAACALVGDDAAITLDAIDEATLAAHSDDGFAPRDGHVLAYANVAQRELASSLASFVAHAEISRERVGFAPARADSIVSLHALLIPLVAGASVVVAPEPVDPKGLRDALAASLATLYVAAPSTWRGLVAAGWQGGPAFEAVAIGPTNPSLARALSSRTGTAWSAFAPWAAPFLVAAHRLTDADEGWLLGAPLGAAKVRVVDVLDQLAPAGVHGELVLRLAAGGTVRTGDRVRWLASGELAHVGRADHKVELRGVVVDLDGVAAELARHPAVADAVVAVRDDRLGEPRLVAYFAARSGESFTETELRSHLRAKLDAAAVPQMFVEQESLPRDRTGAIDDDRLPSPYETRAGGEHVAPRTESERYVAGVWAEALGAARIGIYDNFFDLGGHSLLCFQVIARIEKKTGTRISPRLMLLSSLEQIAKNLESSPVASATPSAPPRAPVAEAPAPLASRLFQRLKDVVKR